MHLREEGMLSFLFISTVAIQSFIKREAEIGERETKIYLHAKYLITVITEQYPPFSQIIKN